MRAVKKVATYADLVALPSHLVGEIIDGELIASPRPASPHARAASRLTMDLGGPFDRGKGGPGGWVILSDWIWAASGAGEPPAGYYPLPVTLA